MKGVGFFRADGSALCLQSGPDPTPPQEAVYTAEVENILDGNQFYDVETKSVLKKKRFATTFSSNKISGIPKGTLVTIPGEQFQVDDGELELESPGPAIIHIHFNHPHYYPFAMEFEIR